MSDEQAQEVKNEQSELEVCQQQRDEYLNNWKRERADFLNYKKDEIKRLEEFVKFANEAVILEIIEILDDLERAAKEIKNEGLDQVLKKFQELLKRYSVERIKVEDEKFDPLLHEAVTAETNRRSAERTEDAENGPEQSESKNDERAEERLEEVRAGYTMNGKVIRPTRVKIIK